MSLIRLVPVWESYILPINWEGDYGQWKGTQIEFMIDHIRCTKVILIQKQHRQKLHVYNAILFYSMNVNDKRYKYYSAYKYLRGYDLRITSITFNTI